MIRNIFFSPSGTSQQIAEKIAADLEGISESYNLTVYEKRNITLNEGDLVLVTCPVYAGRIPPLAISRLRHLKGNGQKAIVIVVYGNRDYDDALLELCDIISHKGFKIVAAAAFVAQHCIFPEVAKGRPDRLDDDKIHDFTVAMDKVLKKGTRLDISKVKGNRPYKK
ncbi:MAG: flavodoxin domain-containing protein, partial [Muribaculaceae bacterium]|nr:flavodoxin domain-containing protein [Muribaculaceae bacterium]